MSQPYVGEIRMFGGSFAPAGWVFCAGQLMPISENEVLFQLLGTTYGGDGEETFGIPDLQGRVPLHMGQGPGLSQNYQIGEKAGTESVTITQATTPTHNHSLVASTDPANTPNPGNNVLSAPVTATPFFQAAPNIPMNAGILAPQGGSQPHDNMMPFLCVSFIISLFGIFPSQT
jgi:microcystin-dependent protein